jgi:hypothetical protein
MFRRDRVRHAYCPETNQIYAVPVDEAPATECLVARASGTQWTLEAVRWAPDSELPA